jgi:hypothetical protein
MRFMRGDVRDRVASQQNHVEFHVEAAKHRSRGVAPKSNFASFFTSFDFRLFQQYRPFADIPKGLPRSAFVESDIDSRLSSATIQLWASTARTWNWSAGQRPRRKRQRVARAKSKSLRTPSLIAAWNERQVKRMPMLFSPTIGAAITARHLVSLGALSRLSDHNGHRLPQDQSSPRRGVYEPHSGAVLPIVPTARAVCRIDVTVADQLPMRCARTIRGGASENKRRAGPLLRKSLLRRPHLAR